MNNMHICFKNMELKFDYIEEVKINESKSNLREPIPMRIRVMVMDYCPNFNRKRSDVVGVKAREYHNNLALEFIEKHPQFAPIIKEIKYIDI